MKRKVTHDTAFVQVNVDGEPMHDTRFRFEVLPKRLKLHVPEPRLLEEASEPAREAGVVVGQAVIRHPRPRLFLGLINVWLLNLSLCTCMTAEPPMLMLTISDSKISQCCLRFPTLPRPEPGLVI